jgi:hypothetical protein
MPTGPFISTSRLGLLALSTLAFACEGSDDPLPTSPPAAINTAPRIVSLKIEPAIIDRGGSAVVRAVVTDADGDWNAYQSDGKCYDYEGRFGCTQ